MCKSFFSHLTSKIFPALSGSKKLLVLIWPLIKTFQPAGQAKAHFLFSCFFLFQFETLLNFWELETNLQNKPDFRDWKWTLFNTLVLDFVLVHCKSCLFIQLLGLEQVVQFSHVSLFKKFRDAVNVLFDISFFPRICENIFQPGYRWNPFCLVVVAFKTVWQRL